MNLQTFHNACAWNDISTVKTYVRKEFIQSLYDELDDKAIYHYEKKNKVANGLFWALLYGNFDIAKFLIEKNVFDPNKLICGEIHILHILATMGGRCTYNLSPPEATDNLLFTYLIKTKYNAYSPQVQSSLIEDIILTDYVVHIHYNEKDVLKFTNWLLDNYSINVSVRTRFKWWEPVKSQTGVWYKFYDNIIQKCKRTLNISFNCSNHTPFHYACLFGRESFVKLLVHSGCDIMCMNCRKMCKDCPYNIFTFYNNSYILNVMLDVYYDIHRDKTQWEYHHYNGLTEISKIETYLKEDVKYILFEEIRKVPPNSLYMRCIEKIANKVKEEGDIEWKQFEYLPPSLKKSVHFFNDLHHSTIINQYTTSYSGYKNFKPF